MQHGVALVWPSQDTHPAVGHLPAWSSWLWHCQDLLCGVRLGMTSLEKAPGGLAAHPSTQLMLMCWIKRWMCKGSMERLVPWAGVVRSVSGWGKNVENPSLPVCRELCMENRLLLLPPRLCSHHTEDEQLHLALVLLQGTPRHQGVWFPAMNKVDALS